MSIKDLVEQISGDPECVVEPASGLPVIEGVLPADVAEFYALCGGAILFQAKGVYGLRIVGPAQMINANVHIIKERVRDDLSDSWLLIAEDNHGNQYVSIDCSVERSGRCYDSHWESHGSAGNCAIIALSFTELLSRLWSSRGGYPYWLAPDAPRYGDAYDKS